MSEAGSNSVEYWADVFREQHVRNVDGVIELGRRFDECGEVAGDKVLSESSRLACYSQSANSHIRQVYLHADSRFSSNTTSLPSGWATLYLLTLLTDDEWQEAIDAGHIKPDMTQADARQLRNPEPPPPLPPVEQGLYRTLVVDPPWEMKKVERDVRPNQAGFDYRTMSVDEIKNFHHIDQGGADEAHCYIWTTQKYLNDAFDVLEAWNYKYIFTMVWHKAGGFQPHKLPQYNCEFVLFGRRGGLGFLDTKAFPTCFNGERREHSRKPDEFYDLVRRVSPGPRIDVFSREKREGFEQYGDESERF